MKYDGMEDVSVGNVVIFHRNGNWHDYLEGVVKDILPDRKVALLHFFDGEYVIARYEELTFDESYGGDSYKQYVHRERINTHAEFTTVDDCEKKPSMSNTCSNCGWAYLCTQNDTIFCCSKFRKDNRVKQVNFNDTCSRWKTADKRNVDIQNVIQSLLLDIAKYFNIPLCEILNGNKLPRCSEPRRIGAYCIYTIFGVSQVFVKDIFKSSRNWVGSSILRVKQWIRKPESYPDAIKCIELIIKKYNKQTKNETD